MTWFAKDESKETTPKSTKIQSLGDLKRSLGAYGGVRCKIFLGRREETGNLFFFFLNYMYLFSSLCC